MSERTYPNDAETLACVARMKNNDATYDAAELARLREIAQKATPGPWDYLEARTLTHIETAQDSPAWGLHIASVPKKATANAAHIAAFDPPTVLSLLDALEKALGDVGRIAKLLELQAEAKSEVLRDIETWAKQRCPCDNDEPKICPLCDADVSKDRCMAVDVSFPRTIRARIAKELAQ